MNCAQVKEQLVDYLYGELSGPARSAFVEHLHGCPGCKAEVAGHEQTLGRTRAALAGPLWQEPPTRVRLAVMEAAKTQARSLRRAEGENRPGFFARLLRTPWLLPACGAASVATVVFLVRVLKNPELVPGRVPSTLLEESVPAAKPHAPAPAAAAPEAPEPAAARLADRATQALRPREEARARRQAKGAPGKHVAPKPAARMKRELPDEFPRGAATASGKKAGGFAEPPPWWEPERKADRSIDDLTGAVKDERPASPPAPATATPQRSRPAPVRDEESALGRPPAVAEPMAEKKAAEAAPRPERPLPSIAAPQPAAASPAAAPPPPAPAAPAAAHTAPPKSRRADPDVTEGEAAATWEPTDKELAKAKAPADGKGAGPALEESVRKADRLYANHDWTAAVAAYRDLLKRFPGHRDAARWRERMNQSLVAAQKSRSPSEAKAGKAAKAKSADALP